LLLDFRTLVEIQEVDSYIQATKNKKMETLRNVKCHHALQAKEIARGTSQQNQHLKTMFNSLYMGN